MHTDDDIFESLNIGGSGSDPKEPPAKGPENDAVRKSADLSAESRIFEDLDMEDRIFSSAFDKGSEKKSAGKQGVRKPPKELNTAESSIDRKTFKKETEKKKKLKIRKIIAAAILEVFTLIAIFAYGYFLRNWNLIQRPDINIEAVENDNLSVEKKEEMAKGYWNIAIFGVDARNDSLVEKGLNSDVIIIASINRENGDIKLVSVFRDTYLNVSENNIYNKVNAAYAMGGPEQALATLNKNLDLNIVNYVVFNWKAVVDGINILGGIDGISLSKAELYYINAYITETVKVTGVGSYQLKNTGEQHLDGVQAVAYARLRYMDNDFARTERQRNVIKACFEKAKDADFSVLNNIMVTCFPQVATNINFNEIVSMAQNITRYNIADTGGFPWQRGEAVISGRGDCVVPATLESNVVKLHEFLFGDTEYTPTDTVLRISETIKEKSGIYREGQVIESVATDGGVIQKPKTPATTAADEENMDEEDIEEVTIGVDEDGNYIYPTDEDGNYIIPTDDSGDIIYPTDEDGNVIRETSIARPTDLSDESDGYFDMFESDVAEGPLNGQGPVNPTGPNHEPDSTRPGGTTPGGSSSSPQPGSPVSPSGGTGSSGSGNSTNTPSQPGHNTSPGQTESAPSGIISEEGPGSLTPGNTGGPSSETGSSQAPGGSSGNSGSGNTGSTSGPSSPGSTGTGTGSSGNSVSGSPSGTSPGTGSVTGPDAGGPGTVITDTPM